MASIKVKYRSSTASGKEGSIYYQIIHGRVVRQIKTDFHVFENEWDNEISSVRIIPKIDEKRKFYLLEVARRIEWDIKRFWAIIAQNDRQGSLYSADSIVEKFNKQTGEQSLFRFMQSIIGQLKQLDKIRTSETYTAALTSFMKFREGQDMLLCEIDSNIMMLYEAWLKGKGICPNTTSFYMRILRAVYNRAVEKELTEQKYPFKHVYTGVGKTVKRAIPLKSIKHIKELDLTLKPHLEYARDMFLFSFYTRGMSFIDMAYLKKSDLKNGIIIYRRRKTGQQLAIKWEKCMEDIISKYGQNKSTNYLLPVITNPDSDERTQYRNAICRINVALKEVAKLAGLHIPLTMHTARHCWASVAKSKNIPLSVISEGMGHDSEETTRIYLASLDTSVIDKANSLILKDF
ncbi:site-specific integrase [Bacteroides ovatus]|jgi:integrase|uniref:site-specific integrase n=1 Tax=Bacteroides ovatus TaxID=28116 RepID=UPI00232D4BC6|nr:site-specific integrase [Bacteroides ovatus]MDC2773623.1 site-specific integrase [Bacteroides ovatus]MDC2783022.1 site-specific integrase [Bacteroides ovatus]MDC2788127.1 site-specific integrase [Bacteroides ovatus]MDC2792615.1 site-specific integrase [Bacteroides ovatus]MDC2797551.1 site-specific integrase [Bacteroides ovatus]